MKIDEKTTETPMPRLTPVPSPKGGDAETEPKHIEAGGWGALKPETALESEPSRVVQTSTATLSEK
jgi:hypothetical protein